MTCDNTTWVCSGGLKCVCEVSLLPNTAGDFIEEHKHRKPERSAVWLEWIHTYTRLSPARVRSPYVCHVEFGKWGHLFEEKYKEEAICVYIPCTTEQILDLGNVYLKQQMRLIFIISSLPMLTSQCPHKSSLWAALIFLLIFSLDISSQKAYFVAFLYFSVPWTSVQGCLL